MGSLQLLLLKENFDADSGWILTDQNSILIDNSRDKSGQGNTQSQPQDADKGDNSAAAVDALQARLHVHNVYSFLFCINVTLMMYYKIKKKYLYYFIYGSVPAVST